VRASPWDVLVSNGPSSLTDLPKGARIGTGSFRRQAQLRHLRPDLQVEDIRGNVDTRLRKLDEGQFDAIVLADAGLTRLELTQRIAQVFSAEQMLPAVGQGALGIECRADDASTQSALQPLDDRKTRLAVVAERSLLAHLRGGCLAPVGAWARKVQQKLQLSAVVLSLDGTQRLFHEETASFSLDEAKSLGQRVADRLLQQGAAALIDSARAGSLDNLQ